MFQRIKNNPYVWTFTLFFISWFVLSNSALRSFLELHRNICYLGLFVIYFFLLIFQYRKKQEIKDCFWLLGSFVFQFIFISATQYAVSTHDMGTFQGFGSTEVGVGHLGYIGYMFNFGHVPDVNPMWVWGYYNPPLHYGLMAAWLGINAACGLPEAVCLENMQLLTMLYSMLSVCVGYSILDALDVSKRFRKLGKVFLSFFPFFTYIAGALGNDALAMLCSFVAILYTIKWYKNNSVKNIVVLAFAIGLGMMTKLNVGLIAPATAFVFLVVLWNRRKEWKKLFLQFVIFGIICVPLGLWWSIRCFVLYDMPIGYVQPILASPIDVSGYSVMERIFSSKEIWLRPFMDYNQYLPTYDYGIFSTAIKTALYCDYPFYSINQWEYQLCRLHVFMTLGLFLAAVGIFFWRVYQHIREKRWDDVVFWFAAIAQIVQFVMFISFAFEFPNVCSADFRYIVPAIIYFMITMKPIKKAAQGTKVSKFTNALSEYWVMYMEFYVIVSAIVYTVILLGLHG